MEMLTAEEVLRIHEVLVENFARSGDPISPPGIKSLHLLESAVSRQHVGHKDVLKYPEPLSNAATLVYGICGNHPFHNGNKRTALVAMLVHLDRNHLCIHGASQGDLYGLLLEIAGHTLGWRPDPRRRDKVPPRRHQDEEIKDIVSWLGLRTKKVLRGEKPLTFRQLRRILARFKFEIDVKDGNAANIVRVVEKPPRLFRRKPVIERERVGAIGYRDEGTDVAMKDIKYVRKICSLREEDGVDSAAFYDESAVVDTFVNTYRTLLRRLART
jgi:death-on-curing protein